MCGSKTQESVLARDLLPVMAFAKGAWQLASLVCRPPRGRQEMVVRCAAWHAGCFPHLHLTTSLSSCILMPRCLMVHRSGADRAIPRNGRRSRTMRSPI